MPVLFSYGSLQEPAVQLSTFGRHLSGSRDVLPGHAIVTVLSNGRARANVVPAAAGALVAGTAFDLTDAELALADEYEAADRYVRYDVTLQSGRRAWIYTFRIGVRGAREDDIGELARVWYEGWHDAHDAIVPEALSALRTLESFRDRLPRALSAVRVVVDADVPVGFAMLRGDELFQFYVARSARGTGVAAPLMRATEDYLAAKGVATAWLACAVGNTRAARFYEKCGWMRLATVTIDSETPQGPVPIQVWRYEKRLRADLGRS